MLLHENERKIAAMHIGGIMIECRLKSFLLLYHRIGKFGERSKRRRDRNFNSEIPNPKHALTGALRKMSDLWTRAKRDPRFILSLDSIGQPLESAQVDYISLRYQQELPSVAAYTKWYKSWRYVDGWLRRNLSVVAGGTK